MYEVWAHLQLRLKRLNVMKCIVCKNQCLVEHTFQLVEGAVCPRCQVAVDRRDEQVYAAHRGSIYVSIRALYHFHVGRSGRLIDWELHQFLNRRDEQVYAAHRGSIYLNFVPLEAYLEERASSEEDSAP